MREVERLQAREAMQEERARRAEDDAARLRAKLQEECVDRRYNAWAGEKEELVAKMTREREERRAEAHKARSREASLAGRLAAATAEREEKADRVRGEYRAQVFRLKEKVAEAEAKVRELEAVRDKETEEREKLDKERDARREAEKKLASAQRARSEAEESSRQLAAKVHNLEVHCAEEKRKAAHEIDKVSASKKDSERRLAVSQKARSEAEKTARNSDKELEKARKECNAKKTEIHDLEKERKALKASLEEEKRKRDKAEESGKRYRKELDESRKSCEAKKSDIKRLQHDKDKFKASAEEERNKREKAAKDLEEEKVHFTEKKELECLELRAKLLKSRGEARDLKKELKKELERSKEKEKRNEHKDSARGRKRSRSSSQGPPQQKSRSRSSDNSSMDKNKRSKDEGSDRGSSRSKARKGSVSKDNEGNDRKGKDKNNNNAGDDKSQTDNQRGLENLQQQPPPPPLPEEEQQAAPSRSPWSRPPPLFSVWSHPPPRLLIPPPVSNWRLPDFPPPPVRSPPVSDASGDKAAPLPPSPSCDKPLPPPQASPVKADTDEKSSSPPGPSLLAGMKRFLDKNKKVDPCDDCSDMTVVLAGFPELADVPDESLLLQMMAEWDAVGMKQRPVTIVRFCLFPLSNCLYKPFFFSISLQVPQVLPQRVGEGAGGVLLHLRDGGKGKGGGGGARGSRRQRNLEQGAFGQGGGADGRLEQENHFSVTLCVLALRLCFVVYEIMPPLSF